MTIFDRERAAFFLLAGFVLLCFLAGGSARDDVQSLLFLRPISALVFVAAITFGLASGVFREHKSLLLLAAALPALALVHLLPLPPAIWSSLPGRELAWRVGEVAGIEQPWRPLSLVPYRTWNSLWAALAPVAVLLLALSAGREAARRMVFVAAALILASGAWGLMQAIQAPGNGFYLYRVTNPDSAVGLFANRNHHAMFLSLSFPLFAAAASLAKGAKELIRPRLYLAIGMGILILPFILVTGSRAGLVLAVAGIASAFFVYRDPAPAKQARRQLIKPGQRWLIIGGLAGGLIVTFALAARATALDRLFEIDPVDDLRFSVWGPIWRAAVEYLPFGSGLGTFVEIYRVIEPTALLGPRYLNHAHNDWLEVVLTAGLPGVAILIWAAVYLGRRVIGAFREAAGRRLEDVVLQRLGGAIVVILALGSAYDYPLRTPSLACLFALATAWLSLRNDRPVAR